LNQDLLKKLLLCRCFHKTCVFFVTAQVNAKFVLQSINVFFIRLIPAAQRMLFTFPCYFKNEIQGKELLYLKMVQTQFGGKRKKRQPKRSIGMANKYHQHLDTM